MGVILNTAVEEVVREAMVDGSTTAEAERKGTLLREKMQEVRARWRLCEGPRGRTQRPRHPQVGRNEMDRMVDLVTGGGVPEASVEEAIEHAVASAAGVDELSGSASKADVPRVLAPAQLEAKVNTVNKVEKEVAEKLDASVAEAVDDLIASGADPVQAKAEGMQLEKEIMRATNLEALASEIAHGNDPDMAEQEEVLAVVDRLADKEDEVVQADIEDADFETGAQLEKEIVRATALKALPAETTYGTDLDNAEQKEVLDADDMLADKEDEEEVMKVDIEDADYEDRAQ
eukprot:scaffold741_cov303-Prasinococcus_capsulatus_cf.AAC.6